MAVFTGDVMTTGCSEVHYYKAIADQIARGNFGIIYSDGPITDPIKKESKFFKGRKHKIKFSNGETLYTLSRYRKPNK